MEENKLSIRINRSLKEVFEFLLDPTKTPLWIDSIVKEEADFPIGIGTYYRNFNKAGEMSEYVVSKFEENRTFEFTSTFTDYKVRYTLTPLSTNEVELEYFEWSEANELRDPFTQSHLDKLKAVLEKK